MNPQILIIATGAAIDEKQVRNSVSAIPGLKLERSRHARGFKDEAVKVMKWIAGFMGDSSKVADLLIEKAANMLAGSSLEIQVGTTIVKINNVNRSQIIELLDKAAEIATKKSDL